MNKVKNRVITLSGQAATGKGTATNILIKKYEEQGMQVNVFATGDKFREYLRDVKELIKAIQDKDSQKCNELSYRETIRTIMYNNDGSLNEQSSHIIKDTIQKIKEKNIDLASYDIEKANRSETLKEIRSRIDQVLDGYVKDILIKEINSIENPNEIWILDSRLAGIIIPQDESCSIRLIGNEKERGLRAYKRFLGNFESFLELLSQTLNIDIDEIKEKLAAIDNKSQEELSDKQKLQEKFNKIENLLEKCVDQDIKNEILGKFSKIKEESYENEESAIEKTSKRTKGEQERFLERYQKDLEDERYYNAIIDTSNLTAEEVAQIIFDTEQKLYSKDGYKKIEKETETNFDEER